MVCRRRGNFSLRADRTARVFWFFETFDDPARLGADEQITTTNGFALRWAEKRSATNASGLELFFLQGSPGGAGVWAAQFESPLPNANLFAYDRPGFGLSHCMDHNAPAPLASIQVQAFNSASDGSYGRRDVSANNPDEIHRPDKIGVSVLGNGLIRPALTNGAS